MFSSLWRLLFAVFILILAVVLVREDSREFLLGQLQDFGVYRSIDKLNISLSEIKKEVGTVLEHLPEPLVAPAGDKEGVLKQAVILSETNRHRKENGMDALVLNQKLSLAAEKKIADMFQNQYFDHVSLKGLGPSDFVKNAGYEYLAIGENLALGIFEDEADLLQAWMDSPGHRANILSAKFSEVGLAARKGSYKGNNVWLAVQEFGRPLSSCPKPSDAERQMIEDTSETANALSNALETMQSDIKAMPKNDPRYNDAVDKYNKMVKEYNRLIKSLRERTEIFNEDVKEFNECAGAINQ